MNDGVDDTTKILPLGNSPEDDLAVQDPYRFRAFDVIPEYIEKERYIPGVYQVDPQAVAELFPEPDQQGPYSVPLAAQGKTLHLFLTIVEIDAAHGKPRLFYKYFQPGFFSYFSTLLENKSGIFCQLFSRKWSTRLHAARSSTLLGGTSMDLGKSFRIPPGGWMSQ